MSSPSGPRTDHGLARLLGAAAMEPELSGILLLDLPAPLLLAAARAFSNLLKVRHGEVGARTILGSFETEDDLWTSSSDRDRGGLPLIPGPSVLSSGKLDAPVLVVLPDLARASLAVTRAATVVLGAPVAEVERHGLSLRASAGTRWLASCRSDEIGGISPHLLDRFVLRFPARRLASTGDNLSRVLDALATEPPQPSFTVPQVLTATVRNPPPVPTCHQDALDRALALHPAAHGVRRPLALVRLARAHARLDGVNVVRAAHIDEVAVLTGLVDPTLSEQPQRRHTPDPFTARDERLPPGGPALEAPSSHSEPDLPDAVTLEAAEEAKVFVSARARPDRPFPEDDAEPEHEATPLRRPWQRRKNCHDDNGAVLGTQPTSRLIDIAWTDTARHAAAFQEIRRIEDDGATRFRVSGADLRRYRRAPESNRITVLMLDHTCHRGWDWFPAIAPALREAYVARSTLCLVEVGGAHLPELTAGAAVCRSLLDPRVSAALGRPAGRSTPLAHGLHLIRHHLRKGMQHGRAAVVGARVVVVTDALGNVPLKASLTGRLDRPVSDEGVLDSLEVARGIGALRGAYCSVIVPPRVPHPNLVADLANALGADILRVETTVAGPSRNDSREMGEPMRVGGYPEGEV